jgi:hypothetical protein
MNGLSMNGLSMNGLSMNGLSMNGLSMNGLETTGGLSLTSGLATTPGGREILKYMVKVAYPLGHSLTFQDNTVPAASYTFDGALGVAPELEFGTCDVACQERISAAMLAHVNNSGLHVGIWLVGPDTGIGWGASPNYPYKEAAYFGNLFTSNMPGNYCAGKDMGSGDAMGRIGSPFGNNMLVRPARTAGSMRARRRRTFPRTAHGRLHDPKRGLRVVPRRRPVPRPGHPA